LDLRTTNTKDAKDAKVTKYRRIAERRTPGAES
jgi:hypothetical protein